MVKKLLIKPEDNKIVINIEAPQGMFISEVILSENEDLLNPLYSFNGDNTITILNETIDYEGQKLIFFNIIYSDCSSDSGVFTSAEMENEENWTISFWEDFWLFLDTKVTTPTTNYSTLLMEFLSIYNFELVFDSNWYGTFEEQLIEIHLTIKNFRDIGDTAFNFQETWDINGYNEYKIFERKCGVGETFDGFIANTNSFLHCLLNSINNIIGFENCEPIYKECDNCCPCTLQINTLYEILERLLLQKNTGELTKKIITFLEDSCDNCQPCGKVEKSLVGTSYGIINNQYMQL